MVSIPSIIAQESESLFTIITDDSSYMQGDIIVVSGDVSAIIEGTPITIQVFFEGNMIDIAQIIPAQDGSFTNTILADGPLWTKDGEYVIRAQYGEDTTETIIEFAVQKETPETIFEVDARNSGTFDVKYSITGTSTLEDIVIEPNIFGIVANINSTSDGTLSLSLPRDFVDAKTQEGQDTPFLVFVDGTQVLPTETKQGDSRTLNIPFQNGDSEIQIIGTFVVPEFSVMVMLVLLPAMIVGIVVSKSRLINRM